MKFVFALNTLLALISQAVVFIIDAAKTLKKERINRKETIFIQMKDIWFCNVYIRIVKSFIPTKI